MNQKEVIQSVKERLERMGYKVIASPNGYGAGVDVYAEKDGEKFAIEAVGESTRHGDQDIVISIGEIVKGMQERRPQMHYGIAIPEGLSRFIKNFGIAGIEALELYLFVVQEWGWAYCLDPSRTVECIKKLKAGESVYFSLVDIEYKPTRNGQH